MMALAPSKFFRSDLNIDKWYSVAQIAAVHGWSAFAQFLADRWTMRAYKFADFLVVGVRLETRFLNGNVVYQAIHERPKIIDGALQLINFLLFCLSHGQISVGHVSGGLRRAADGESAARRLELSPRLQIRSRSPESRPRYPEATL